MVIYTDGACSNCSGGWAYVVVDGEVIHKDSGGLRDTTSNRMEQYAVLKAIEWMGFNNYKESTILTDSIWVKNGFFKMVNNPLQFKKAYKKNVDLWDKIRKVSEGMKISVEWIKGHSGHRFNEMADRMAVQKCLHTNPFDVIVQNIESFNKDELELYF